MVPRRQLLLSLLKVTLVLPMTCVLGLAHADVDRGRAVAAAEYAASHGYGDFVVALQMDLVSTNGKTQTRKLRLNQMETPTHQVKTLVIFDLPKAIADTALLTWSNVATDDDQWLFLPAIKRVKKIASKDRSGPFVGSTFAYEDLADYAINEFTYTWVREETCEMLTCDVIERRPKDPFSGYLRQLVWIDNADHRIRRVEYFDRRNGLLKTLESTDFARYPVAGRTFVQPHQMTMKNVQTGRSTVLRWSPYQYDAKLNEVRDFSTNALKRVR